MAKDTKKAPSLSKLLRTEKTDRGEDRNYDKEIEALQLRMLRAQQGIYHRKARAIIAFEGFDAAGKGGAIRHLTEKLDPRGVKVHPIGPPEGDEQGKHYLYRFWARLPAPGTIAVFDRTWYGRVLVERVDKLIDRDTYGRAYREIREFEAMLTNDGVELIKIFIGISKDEQLKRFEDRLRDPYKRWKIGEPDIKARAKWNKYVNATDDLFEETHVKGAHWHLIAGDNKPYTRYHVLKTVVEQLEDYERWMEKEAKNLGTKDVAAALKELGLPKKSVQ
jgi:polyphosphate kinase 2 (PPK2 family)